MSKMFLVETLVSYKIRYVVDVPDDGDASWAADAVVMHEAEEFTQKYIDESVLSVRPIQPDDLFSTFEEDSDGWSPNPEYVKSLVYVTGKE